MGTEATTDAGALGRQLEDARRELLDLTPRNRLLATARRRARSSSIEVIDERSEQVFHILVGGGRAMSFEPAPEPPPEDASAPSPAGGSPGPEPPAAPEIEPASAAALEDDAGLALAQPEEDADEADRDAEADEIAPRHLDTRLQTALATEVLQRRLLRMYHDARTYQEEQGVNILFLALGFLRWYEAEGSDLPRDAPLILVPVELDRRSARSRFRVRWTGEDVTTNLSLQVKMKAEFGIDLPDVPDDVEDLSPAAYLDAVRRAVAPAPRWEVLPNDIVLWFFSFAKLLMYRDLDPGNWPQAADLTARPIVRALLAEGFAHEPPLCGEDEMVDGLRPTLDTLHVLDADSSQSLAIEEVRRGRNLVIQGPPGTGKSQTIANLIAAAVGEGKRVLFAAEKVAALDVVKRRLTNIGLGDMCLELHSNKAKKREVVQELGRTLDLPRPIVDDVAATAAQLDETRARLNAHCEAMHARDEPSALTPFRTVGVLVRLRADGVPSADFALPDAEAWSAEDVRSRTRTVAELADYIAEIGTPAAHPWRGVGLDASLPMDRERLGARLPGAAEELETLIAALRALADDLGAEIALTGAGAARLAALARALARAPALDLAAHADPAWERHRADLTGLVEVGAAYAEARRTLDGVVTQAAWAPDLDVAGARRDLAAHGASLLRLLHGSYRRSMATLRGISVGRPPRALAARIEILDTLIAGRSAWAGVEAGADLGQRAFGRLWRGPDSDWAHLAAIESWDRVCTGHPDAPASLRRDLAGLGELSALAGRADDVDERVDRVRTALEAIFAAVALDLGVAFGPSVRDVDDVPLDAALERLEAWRRDPDAITRWITLRQRDAVAREQGLGGIADRLRDGRLEPAGAVASFRMAYHEIIMRRLVRANPALGAFDGLSHERVLAEFQRLDRMRIALARQQVAMRHHERIPRGGEAIGELGLIRREMSKRRRHLPIRQLLSRAGHAATRIKPVFMMSPLSIAQYVEPGALEFDVLMIDEASQVRPVEALGAAARARQIVVVGDDKQLPPTRFFMRSLDDLEPDEPDAEQRAGDLESILGLCRAQNMSDRMLRWHYRSRHHSLIAVSNHEFYDDRLYVIPSPTYGAGAGGLVFRRVEGGVYDRGGSATNRVEAATVASAVMDHAAQLPHLTLGVGAFSIRQRDAILDELERLRRERPEHEEFFAPGAAEPFFVKNLENVQGDERDVIFISVGFGPDADGTMTMNFGPVSAEGGERRLNVLITRARRRCEVFSSITHEAIDLARATGRGPKALKTFLAYAQTGVLDLALPRGSEGGAAGGPDSPFEASVSRAIAAQGYELDGQVGVAGFFIDLAVKDREQPGRYVLGIECDGASYHASRSARDRDRIRQQVLEDRGWTIHRIWSTDWFNRPDDELRKAVAAIERARAAATGAVDPGGATAASVPAVRREDEHPDPLPGQPAADAIAVPYVEASFRVPSGEEIHELSPERLAKVVTRIVEIEGPVHGDEIAQRVTSLWGLSRTGSRIQRSVDAAAALAAAQGAIRSDGGFYSVTANAPLVVRSRGAVSSSTLRDADMLPPSEIRRCLELLLERHLGAARDELIVATARVLGYRSTSSRLRGVIDAQIDQMLAAGAIAARGDRLHLPGK